MHEQALLVCALGVRDVAIGSGILAGRSGWMRYRAAAGVMDLCLMALKVLTGPRRPIGRLLAGVGATMMIPELARKASAGNALGP